MSEDEIIKGLVSQQNFDEAETYLNDNVLDKRQEVYTIQKSRRYIKINANEPSVSQNKRNLLFFQSSINQFFIFYF